MDIFYASGKEKTQGTKEPTGHPNTHSKVAGFGGMFGAEGKWGAVGSGRVQRACQEGDLLMVGTWLLLFRRYILCKHACLRKGWNKAELLQPVGQVHTGLLTPLCWQHACSLPSFLVVPLHLMKLGGEGEVVVGAPPVGLTLFRGGFKGG